jgi:mono/diheme cytochrome c family protein
MPSTALLGIVFVVLGFAAMFLMYHLWGYPFDKATRTSAAPRWAMYLHRVLGYLFAAVYIALMWKMVPRLWEYQVEFPARTVVHIVVGLTIGFLLLVKIAIMRLFRHFEEWMPYLGTAIMLGTIILIGLSIPIALHEHRLSERAFSEANRVRVAQLLPTANLPGEAPSPAELSTEASLRHGRRVLLDNCVKCHDLKTVLVKPRSPSGWWTTVERMSDKPALFDPLTEREMFDVTAYLIAITPDLQRSSKQKREQRLARDTAISEAAAAMSAPGEGPAPGDGPAPDAGPASGSGAAPAGAAPPPARKVDLAAAKKTYEEVCSQCHELDEIAKAPPRTKKESREMIQRMIEDNEAELTPAQIEQVAAWLDAEFVAKQEP